MTEQLLSTIQPLDPALTAQIDAELAIWHIDRLGQDPRAGAEATVEPLENHRAHIRLATPQRAITPGQASVFYDGDRVIGGGWITRKPSLVAA